MMYRAFSYQELKFIEEKARIFANFYDECVPEYLNASELAHYIKIKFDRKSCSPQEVNDALHNCFGDTKQSDKWEIPQIVPPSLYKKIHRGHYHWHIILIDVIDDQIFGQKDVGKLLTDIDKFQSQQFSNN